MQSKRKYIFLRDFGARENVFLFFGKKISFGRAKSKR